VRYLKHLMDFIQTFGQFNDQGRSIWVDNGVAANCKCLVDSATVTDPFADGLSHERRRVALGVESLITNLANHHPFIWVLEHGIKN